MGSPKFTVTCVVDNHPRLWPELILWVHCVQTYLPSEKFTPVVYLAGDVPYDLRDWISSQRIAQRSTEPVVVESPHCNRIAPFLDAFTDDYTIVTDVDLFFVSDPSNLFNSQRIRAAPNNHCNPPGSLYREILKASGLNRPYRPSCALFRGESGTRETHINNISAGIVAVPCSFSQSFGLKWKRWAEWLITKPSLLDRWVIHIDQVAFSLAAEDAGYDVEFLPPQANTILHSLEELSTIYAFHLTSAHIPLFPQFFNANKTLNEANVPPGVRDSVRRLNRCIVDAVHDISRLASTRAHLVNFLNPGWHR